MATTIVPVILCGGAGTRLWPLSRRQSPKQFLPLIDEGSLFDQAVLRGLSISRRTDGNDKPMLCVTVDDYKFMVQDALDALGVKAEILVEPEGRGTAAALCIAAQWVAQTFDNATMVVLPSDQMIEEGREWRDVVALGHKAAQDQCWVSIGISPASPSSAFGYIQPGDEGARTPGVFAVGSFLEKPEPSTAEQLIHQGWLWNAGIAIVQAGTVLQMVEKHAPEVFSAAQAAMKSLMKTEGFFVPDREQYCRTANRQIDKAVLEKSDNISVIPFHGHWRDIGTWEAVEQLSDHGGQGNRVSGDVIIEDCQQVYVRSPHRLIVALGLEDVAIVDTPDVLLVARKNTLGGLANVVDQLAKQDRPEADVHHRVARPWGHYDVKTVEPGYKVKCVLVRPGASLSSQFHHHRAEHWVVVKGVATVFCDGKECEVNVNESVFIAQGSIHRLENRTDEPLELVEVQTGHYLGEDDIVRVEDAYGRI